MKRNKIRLLTIVLTLVLVVVGCSKTSTDNNKEEAVNENNIQESNYIHLTMLYPKSTNPILNTEKSVSYIMNLIYDGLFEIDDKYNVQPRLVDKYNMSSDGKTMDITLLSNAKWHDGSEVTSSDVDFTIDLIKKNKTSPYYDLVSDIQSVGITNSKNFTLKFTENNPFEIDKLTFPIVSKNKLNGLKDSELSLSKKNSIGNGPYKIKEYVERQHLILERNEKYFGDLPENRKEIFVKVVPDIESQTEMVLSLDSDIANISIGELSKFEGKKEFNITKYQGRDYEMVMFNYQNNYLKNVNIRKAIAASVDREKILKDAYVDNGSLTNFPLNTTSKYYDAEIKSIPFNKESAENYLKKGLATLGKKLKLENPNSSSEEEDKTQTIIEDNNINGSASIQLDKADVKRMLADVEFKIIVSKDNEERVKVANMIRENLQTIGIKSIVSELEDEAMTKALEKKEYDMAVIGYSLSSVPDARNILKSLNIEDKKLDSYIISLSKSNSESETKRIYNQIQNHVVKNTSFISIGVLDNFIVKNKRLNGDIYPNYFDIYKGISNLQMTK
ncbi:MAG: ABC transporter substrate-binding protein [Terrisporobacter sp.]|uniref:ABC transporter substrate-binding protein n=1 Tax=Terrisporobacter sp. TaxID=1965305 RepID=UPI002FC9264F